MEQSSSGEQEREAELSASVLLGLLRGILTLQPSADAFPRLSEVWEALELLEWSLWDELLNEETS